MFLRLLLLYIFIGTVVGLYVLFIQWKEVEEVFTENDDLNKCSIVIASLVFHAFAWPYTMYHYTKGVWFGGDK